MLDLNYCWEYEKTHAHSLEKKNFCGRGFNNNTAYNPYIYIINVKFNKTNLQRFLKNAHILHQI